MLSLRALAGPLLRAAAVAAVLAAPLQAQMRSAPLRLMGAAMPAAGPAATAASWPAAASLVALPAPILAAPALSPAAFAFAPPAMAANPAAPIPAARTSLDAIGRAAASDAPSSAGMGTVYDGASSPKDLELPSAVRASEDHAAVARMRAGIVEVRRLKEAGQLSRAMELVRSLLEDYSSGPVSRTAHRDEFLAPLVHLESGLRQLALDVYLAHADSRGLGIDLKGDGVRGWVQRRRAADRDAVVGTVAAEPVAVQRWSDCAVQALWNLPALRSLRARTTYRAFLETAEKLLGRPVRREGLGESGESRLLEHLGWRRSATRSLGNERDLVEAIKNYDGVLGSYDFPMSHWKALFGTGSFDTRFLHGVALTAAVRDRGRWWFVVLDSQHPYPRVLTYGELLILGLKFAVVTPS